MSEYLTKADMLQHEKEASTKREEIAVNEQRLRHDL